MTASSADPGRRGRPPLILAVASLATLLAAGATAQPLILKRQGPPPGAASPAGQGERPAAPAPATEGERIPPRPFDGQGIVVDSLDAVDSEAVGLIGPAEGGFGTGLWQGTPWRLVATLMPRMPEMSLSPAVRSLTKRLLLSRAGVPDGKPAEANFVQIRVDRLVAMGDVADALALLATVPEVRRDQQFARSRIDALFYDGQRNEACNGVASQVGRYEDAYWRQARAFCLALNGEHARAGLMADLLRERGDDTPPVFYAAVERLGGAEPGKVRVSGIANGLTAAMVLAAKLPIEPQLLNNARPAVLRAIALSTDAEPGLRLLAAEKALAFGALTDEQLFRLYDSFPFSDSELSAPITTAENAWNPRVRALLVRAAARQRVSLGKAEVLRRAWQLGREKGDYAEIVRASLPVLAGMEASPALSGFAADAARVLFAGGRLDEAVAWYGILAADGDRVPESREAADALWPFAVLAGAPATGKWTPDRLTTWYESLRQRDPENALRQALSFFSLLEATGREVPAPLWRAMLDGPMVSLEPGLNRAWARNLEGAGENGWTGEVGLLVVTGAAATGDRTFASDAAGYRAIVALRRAGLEDDARRLAVETAVAAGL